MEGLRIFIRFSGGGGYFSNNYVEIRKYRSDLQMYIDFIVNRNRTILISEADSIF